MLEVIGIQKSYQGAPLLKGITFNAAAGETICLLGSSGSGKSTLLHILAGLEDAEAGEVRWESRDMAAIPAHERHFGLMFQDYALFPHLTVAENVAFGLKMQNIPPTEIEARVGEVLERVNLGAFGDRRVTELSGGEQQRVALARTIAPHPRLLMLDEPLGALDHSLRGQLMTELRKILHETGVPAIYVTHDQEEAFALASRVLLLHEGKIVQAGTPAEVYTQPESVWAARFLGLGNVITGKVCLDGRVQTEAGVLMPTCPHTHMTGESVVLLIRPGGARLGAGENSLEGRVADVVFQKETYRITLDNGLYADLEESLTIGQEVNIRFPTVQCLGYSP